MKKAQKVTAKITRREAGNALEKNNKETTFDDAFTCYGLGIRGWVVGCKPTAVLDNPHSSSISDRLTSRCFAEVTEWF